jgi:hypothetical protein
MQTEGERIAFLNRVLDDLPRVHVYDDFEPPHGVWSTETACYELMASRCQPGSSTLETGLGVSTVLFTGWGCDHICVMPGADEAARLRGYCETKGIDTSRLDLRVVSSDIELPRLPTDLELDLVFVDGAHSFPMPAIDWYFAGQKLRHGGTLILDDIALPALSRGLVPFLDADPRWVFLAGTSKWRAYERAASGPLLESWDDQMFFFPLPGRVTAARRFAGRVKRRILRRT